MLPRSLAEKHKPCGHIPGSRLGQHCRRPTTRQSPGNRNRFQGLAPPSRSMQDRHLSLNQLVGSLVLNQTKLTRSPLILHRRGSWTRDQQKPLRAMSMVLASAEDDALGRPIQLTGLGRTGQNLTEHIERSETPENQVRRLASKVQEQNRLRIPELVLNSFDWLQGCDSRQRSREAA